MSTFYKVATMGLLLSSFTGEAQWVKLNSTRPVRPQLSLGSLSLTASPSVVNMTLVPGAQSGASPTIMINNLLSLTALGTFSLYGWFQTTSALSSSSGAVIPVSAVYGKCGTTASYASFTQPGPLGTNTSLLLYQTSSLTTLLLNQTQSCTLMIDLTNIPQLPAGVYSGTVIIQAQAL